MREVKGNYKGNSDLTMQWQRSNISEKIPKFQDITRNTPCDTYFNDEEEATSTVTVTDIIQRVKTKLNEHP